MSKKNLFTAIASEGPPPCLAHDCKFEYVCAEQKLACEAFRHYVATGIALHPSTHWLKGQSYVEEDYFPTKSHYALLYRPDPNMPVRKKFPDEGDLK